MSFYPATTQKQVLNSPITDRGRKGVVDGPLWTVLFTMQRVAGSQGVHQVSRAHMLYAIEAMAPTVFNWAEAMLSIFKDQLTKCQKGELKQFGFGFILA